MGRGNEVRKSPKVGRRDAGEAGRARVEGAFRAVPREFRLFLSPGTFQTNHDSVENSEVSSLGPGQKF